MEVFQHKGDSECRNGLSGFLGEPDELCDFEKLRRDPVEDCGDCNGARMIGQGCMSRLDFLRGILLEGMSEQARLGVNPYSLGVIASNGYTQRHARRRRGERVRGALCLREGTPEARLTGAIPGGPQTLRRPGRRLGRREQPGSHLRCARPARNLRHQRPLHRGAHVWWMGPAPETCVSAETSSRWATSRCSDGADAGGLARRGRCADFREGISALRDPGTAQHLENNPQRIQIVKGWLDADSEAHEVIDVAGGDNGASVDEDTCEPIAGGGEDGAGAESLCAVWRDPDYDPETRPTTMRAVENPSLPLSARIARHRSP